MQEEKDMQKKYKIVIGLILAIILMLGSVFIFINWNSRDKDVATGDNQTQTQADDIGDEERETSSEVKETDNNENKETEKGNEKETQKETEKKTPVSSNNNSGAGNSTTDNSGASDDSQEDGSVSRYYEVLLHCEDENSKKMVKENTIVNSIEAPVLEGMVFLKWYYDSNFSKPVGNSDTVTSDIELYAKYGDSFPINGEGAINYLVGNDVSPDFSFIVKASDKDADFVLNNLSLKNYSDKTRTDDSDVMEKDELSVQLLSDGSYKVYCKNGFKEGHSYQIEKLSDELTFEDSSNDIVYYNLTISKKEVKNLTLSDDLKYLSVNELSESDRAKLLEYQGLFKAETDSQTGEIHYRSNNCENTFTYKSGTFSKGDTVAIYEGERPDLRELDYNGDKGTSYVTITAVNGNQYTYKSADSEDVLFIPDILPVDIDNNDGVTGWQENGMSFTINNEKLDFSENYVDVGLGIETTVEVGDFIAFFTGTYGDSDETLKRYGKITKVLFGEETTYIEYETVTFEQMKACMDLFQKSQMTDEQLESAIDKQYITQLVNDQLEESGFLEESAQYLSVMALQTDEVKALLGEDNLSLENCEIIFRNEDGTEIPMDQLVLLGDQFNFIGNNSQDKGTKVSVNISTKLEHFADRGRGVRVEIAFTYKFDIRKQGSRHKVEVELAAVFESEILFDLSVDGTVIWKVAGIFPYIYDYNLTGKFDRGVYTGIALTATAKLDNVEGPFQLPFEKGSELESAGTAILNIGNAIKDKLKNSPNPFPEAKGTASGDLVDKYSAFVEDASDNWVDLFELPLFETYGSFDSFGISAYGIKGVFVTSANVNVALGITIQAEDSQRNEFSMMLIHREAGAETLSTGTTCLRYDMYVMGVLGIRSGVRVKVTFGLFSTKLAGIGLQVEGGVYAKLYGYFYYTYSWEKGKGTESYAKGALLLDVGLYVDIRFVAEVLDGKFSYMPKLYANEWSLWTAGYKYDAQDFKYDEETGYWEEMRNGRKIRGNVPLKYTWIKEKEFTLPSDLFVVDALDLTNGEHKWFEMDSDKAGVVSGKDTAGDDEERFIIDIQDNDVFKYDPATNKITVTPRDTGELMFETDMTIAWKQPSLSFSTQTISRTIHLKWIDPDSGNSIIWDSRGGSYVEPLYYRPGTKITKPEDPTKVGYEFGGWYVDGKPYVFPDRMPDYNTTPYAKWIPIPNQYFVSHYVENEFGFFEYVDQNVDTSVYTDDAITLDVLKKNFKAMEGFEVDMERTELNKKVGAYGSTNVKVFYKRKIHTVTYTYGDLANKGYKDIVYEYKYGKSVNMPLLYVAGYVNEGWDGVIPATMPDEDLTYNCKWSPSDDIEYHVQVYVEKPDGDGYVQYIGKGAYAAYTGCTDAPIDVDAIVSELKGYSLIRYESNYMNGSMPYIDGAGYTVVKLYIKSNTYSVRLDAAGGTLTENVISYKTGEEVILPTPVKTGYTFIGWSDGVNKVTSISRDEYGDKVYVAIYEPQKTEVLLYDENSDITATIINKYGELPAKLKKVPEVYALEFIGYFTEKEGGEKYYNADGTPAKVWNIADSKIALYPQFNKIMYDVTYDANGGECDITSESKAFNEEYGALPTPERTGYRFAGWFTKAEYGEYITETTVMSIDGNHTLYAHWNANTDVKYIVESYAEGLDGTFELYKTSTHYGESDKQIKVLSDNIPGFTFDEKNENSIISGAVKADGTSVFKLYYTRNTYTVTYYNPATGENVTKADVLFGSTYKIDDTVKVSKEHYKFTGWSLDNRYVEQFEMPAKNVVLKAEFRGNEYLVQYDANEDSKGTAQGSMSTVSTEYDLEIEIGINQFVLQGYVFDSWNSKADGTGDKYLPGMVVKNLTNTDGDVITLYAIWKPATDTEYKVNVYQVMSVKDGIYEAPTLMYSKNKNGTTGDTTSETIEDKKGFTADINQVVIAPDGSSVVNIYYVRNTYMLTWNLNGGTADNEYTEGEVYYNDRVTIPSVTKQGYILSWDMDITDEFYMVDKDTIINAIWIPDTNTKYTVHYYGENVAGDDYELLVTKEYFGTTDSTVKAPFIDVAGFTAPDSSYITIAADGSASVRYNYTRNTYKVTYSSVGTSSAIIDEIKYGAAYSARENTFFSRTGYTFDSWASSDIPDLTAFTMPAKDVTITAQWNANSYTVRFNGNAADIGNVSGTMEDQVFTYNVAEELSKNIYEISGYEFNGWNTKADGTGDSYNDCGTVKNLTSENMAVVELYAQWSANTDTQYTVKHHKVMEVNDGEYVNVTLIREDTKYGVTGAQTNAVADTMTGFTPEFTQKAILGDGTTVVDIYYIRNKYSITWILNEGIADNEYTSGEIYYGDAIVSPNAVKTGYVLSWDKEIPAVMGAEDLVIEAVWKPAADTKYTVNYYIEDISGESNTKLESVPYFGETDMTVEAPRKDIVGFTKPDAQNVTILPDGSAEVNYLYSRNTYTITYTMEGSNDTFTEYVKYGEEHMLQNPALTKTGYTIDSLVCDDVDVTKKFEMPAKNLTVSTVWKANSYTVKYLANEDNLVGDVSGTVDNQMFTYDVLGIISDNGYNVIGYSFAGWNTKADGSGTDYQPGDEVSNLTADNAATVYLYAKWSPNTDTKYTVNIYAPKLVVTGQDANGVDIYGVSEEYELINYWDEYGTTGETAEYNKDNETFDSEHYIFERSTSERIKGDETTEINAYYGRKVYKLVYDLDGGVLGDGAYTAAGSDIYYGATVVEPTVTKPGYKVYSWSLHYSDEDKTVTYSPDWREVIGNYKYTLNVYKENIDGSGYTLSPQTITLYNKKPNTVIDITPGTYEGFTILEEYNKKVQLTVTPDNQASIDLYYSRNSYNLTYNFKGLEPISDEYTKPGLVKYGTPLVMPKFEKAGYDVFFATVPTKMPAEDKSIELSIIPKSNIPYKFVYMDEDAERDENGNVTYSMRGEKECKGTAGDFVDGSLISKTAPQGFEYVGFAEGTTINGDGSTVVNVYFDRKLYELSYDFAGGIIREGVEYSKPGYYRYGQKIHLPTTGGDEPELTFPGAISYGPNNGGDKIMPAEDYDVEYLVYYPDLHIMYESPLGANCSNLITQFNADKEFILPIPEITDGFTFIRWEILTDDTKYSNIEIFENTIIFKRGATIDESIGRTIQLQPIVDMNVDQINVDLNGGTLRGTNNDGVYKYMKETGENIGAKKLKDVPDPEKEGYVFAYWSGGQNDEWLDENLSLSEIRTSGITPKANWLQVEFWKDYPVYPLVIVNTQEELAIASKVVTRLSAKHPDKEYNICINSDIELNDIYFKPVMEELDCELDGRGHTITFNSSCYEPLIGTIKSNGVIKNVKFTGNVIKPDTYEGNKDAAMLTYNNQGTIEYVDFVNINVISYLRGMGMAAVVATELNGGTIRHCKMQNLKVSGSDDYTGVVVAKVNSGIIFKNNMTGLSAEGGNYIGLLAGGAYGGEIYANWIWWNDLFDIGKPAWNSVEGMIHVGGFIGHLKGSKIENNDIECINVKGYDYVGGYIGTAETPFDNDDTGTIWGASYLCAYAFSKSCDYVGGMVGYYSCDEESAKGMYFQHISVSSENICYPLCGNHSKVYCLKPRFLDITYNGLKWY